MIFALLAAAAAILFWPTPPHARRPAALALEPAKPARPTYAHALHALAAVRSRLAATDHLGDAERKSIDTLTLALVAGSDAE